MQERATPEGCRKVLLLGPSSFYWQEKASTVLLKDLIISRMEEATGGAVTCVAERLFFGPAMAPRMAELLDRHEPDAVLLYLGSGPFELQSIVHVIRNRWPKVYGPALKMSNRVKRLAGGGLEGSAGPRGWLFRLPRRLVARVVGLGSMVSLEEAIGSSIDTINVLCQRENVISLVYFSAVSWAPSMARELAMVAEFDRRVRAHCRQRSMDYFYRQEEMAKRGFVPRRGRDGVHAEPATYAFEAGILTELLCDALEIEPSAALSSSVPPPAARSPDPRA